MTISTITRRSLLRGAALLPLVGGGAGLHDRPAKAKTHDRLADLEKTVAGGRLGVAALNTATGAVLRHRADERFAFCSTFKILATSAVLRRSAMEHGLLERRIAYTERDLIANSPITSQHAGEGQHAGGMHAGGMMVAALCAAALQYSDNTAANLILWLLGGPPAVTAFARSIGDHAFRLDRWETALNDAVPGDARDTSTPAAMMRDVQRLALGPALAAPQRDQLVAWLRGNTTGAKRIRAGVPADWSVADKTGTGDYGTSNDIGVVWPPGKQPLLLVVYFTQGEKNAAPRDDVVAAASKIAIDALR